MLADNDCNVDALMLAALFPQCKNMSDIHSVITTGFGKNACKNDATLDFD